MAAFFRGQGAGFWVGPLASFYEILEATLVILVTGVVILVTGTGSWYTYSHHGGSCSCTESDV